MITISDSGWAFSQGINSAGKAFLQRWLELFHQLTTDNYRVIHLNVRVGFGELRHVIDESENKVIESSNIQDVSAEVLKLLKTDPIAKLILPHHEYYYVSLEKPYLGEQTKVAHPGLKVLVEQACEKLDSRYRAAIIDAIAIAIEENDVEKTILLTSLLASDLVHLDYDFRYLLWKGLTFIRRPRRVFTVHLQEFLNQLKTGTLQTFLVAYRMDFANEADASRCPSSLGAMEIRSASNVTLDSPSLQSHIPGPNVRLATLSLKAYDVFAASRKGGTELHRALDIIQFAKPSIQIISHNLAHVVFGNGQVKTVPTTLELLGPIRIANDEIGPRMSQLTTIRGRVEKGSIRRLELGLQYLRRGLTESVPQGQYLNYWIGLEAIAGGKHRTEITTIRKTVSQMLAMGYPRRIVRDLLENFDRLGIATEPILGSISTELHGHLGRVEALWKCICNESLKSQLLGLAAVSPLLQSRIGDNARLFGTARKTRETLATHRQDIDWHVQRLYRVRNAIVHGGETPSDLTHLGSHLATYLWVLLRSILDDFASDSGTKDIGKFFDKHLKIHEMVLLEISRSEQDANPPFAILLEPTLLWP